MANSWKLDLQKLKKKIDDNQWSCLFWTYSAQIHFHIIGNVKYQLLWKKKLVASMEPTSSHAKKKNSPRTQFWLQETIKPANIWFQNFARLLFAYLKLSIHAKQVRANRFQSHPVWWEQVSEKASTMMIFSRLNYSKWCTSLIKILVHWAEYTSMGFVLNEFRCIAC